jgi:hypothetical protein
MAYESSRWRHEESPWLSPAERARWDAWRDAGDHGRFSREPGGYGRAFGGTYPNYRTESPYAGWRDGRHEDHERNWLQRASDEVSSWFGDDDAQRRRVLDEADKGRRGRGPKGYVRSDARIREDVCDRLCDDSVVDATEIEVTVAGSEVTLSGTVDTRRERRRAEDCAERVSGVTHVQNNLRVTGEGRTGEATGMPPPFI